MNNTEELRIYLRTIADTTGARQTEQSLRGISTSVIGMSAATGGLLLAVEALRAFIGFAGDSVNALRQHEKAMRLSSAAYATMSTEVKNLDAAFVRAEKSGNAFQVIIGRLAEPAALTGLKGIGIAMETITKGLTNTARMAAELQKAAPWLFQGLAAAPGPVVDIVSSIADQFVAAGQSIQREERAIAQRTQEQRNRRLRELNEAPLPPVAGRLEFWDQVRDAVTQARQAQQAQVQLQREGVNLAAQEAALRLSMLPNQMRMAELQRQITEQQIRAQQAALPATERLEDLRYMRQRAELIARNRNVPVEARIGARRELRAIGRAEPGVELAALEAGRGVTLAGRVATRAGFEQQLFEISTQRQLAQIEQAQLTNTLLSVIAAQRTQAIELTINLGTEEFQKEVFKQLVEATNQAQGPTVIQLSGVRR